MTRLTCAVACALVAALAARGEGQVRFEGAEGGARAAQNGVPMAGGQWTTLNLDPSTLSGAIDGAVGTLSGNVLTLALAGLSADQIADAVATHTAETITGTWTFTSGSITYGAGSGSKYITLDAASGTDPKVGVRSGLAEWVWSNVGIALGNGSGGANWTTGIRFYSSNSDTNDTATLMGSWVVSIFDSTKAYYQSASINAAAIAAATATNNTYTNLKVATTAVTCPTSGTTCTATNAIPAGCLLVGVSSRVTTAGNGSCASYDIGTTATANLFSNDTATTAGTTTNNANFNAGTALAPMLYPSATSITATCNGGTFSSTAAAFRFGVHCIDVTAPAS